MPHTQTWNYLLRLDTIEPSDTFMQYIPNAVTVLLTTSRDANVKGLSPFTSFQNVSFFLRKTSEVGFPLLLEKMERLVKDFQSWKNPTKMQKVLENAMFQNYILLEFIVRAGPKCL